MPTEIKLFSYKEASALLGVSESCLRQWVMRGEIPHRKLGKRFVRFTREDLEAVVRPKAGAR